MKQFIWIAAIGAIAAGSWQSPAHADEALDVKAYQILKTYCADCHSKKQVVEDFNILRRDSLLKADRDLPYVVANKRDDSYLWWRVGDDKDMPPEDHPNQPSDEEREIIGQWIASGAGFPPPPDRPFVSNLDVLTAIQADLNQAQREDQRFYRYFSLANLWNNDYEERIGTNGKKIDDEDIRLARAALSKLLNSLSLEDEIVLPVAVDEYQTVFRIDLREYGWDQRNIWPEILRKYPYGLKLDDHPESAKRRELDQRSSEITTKTGTALPCIRVDWFIDQASRPPLYNTILGLPNNVGALERALRVDVNSDFLNDRIARAGFAESKVSQHNRLVDRHPALYGYYWKSYDFASSEQNANLFKNPLGPPVEDDDRFEAFSEVAFEHDGGEMIFSLPNGLQGYYLSDAEGNQLDEGPTAIVRDLNETGGSPAVVNGLSCMWCHKHGMFRFEDTIRQGLAVEGDLRDKAERLFKTKAEMDKILDADEASFMKAVEKATAPFLQVDGDEKRDIRDFREPIGEVAKIYQKDVELEEAAVELGYEDPKELLQVLKANPELRRRNGLGALINGKAIKRSTWSSLKGFLSPFQRTANALDRGTPHREL